MDNIVVPCFFDSQLLTFDVPVTHCSLFAVLLLFCCCYIILLPLDRPLSFDTRACNIWGPSRDSIGYCPPDFGFGWFKTSAQKVE